MKKLKIQLSLPMTIIEATTPFNFDENKWTRELKNARKNRHKRQTKQTKGGNGIEKPSTAKWDYLSYKDAYQKHWPKLNSHSIQHAPMEKPRGNVGKIKWVKTEKTLQQIQGNASLWTFEFSRVGFTARLRKFSPTKDIGWKNSS